MGVEGDTCDGRVSEVDGALHVKNIPEPPPPEPVTRPMELYINGELVSKWDE
ncbi:TPA: phage tail protein [Escherichia coli]|nr:phage tail protein [Escherichia coli]